MTENDGVSSLFCLLPRNTLHIKIRKLMSSNCQKIKQNLHKYYWQGSWRYRDNLLQTVSMESSSCHHNKILNWNSKYANRFILRCLNCFYSTWYFILDISYNLSIRLPWLSIHIFLDQIITMKALKNCIMMQSGQSFTL